MHAEGIPARKLNTLRNARGEDSRVYPIIWELGDVLPYAGYVFEPSDMDDKFRGFIEELRDRGVRTTADFYALLDEIEDYFEAARADGKNVSSWNGHNHMTIAKVRNRFKVLPNKCGGLLAHGRVEHGDLPRADGPFEDNEMRVVDISQLTGVPQDLIVTSVVSKIWELAETGRLGVDKLIIFVDELNKYAPSGNSRTSSLKDTLVDISARGRHLNLTLFGAQQFRSKVDDEVIGNAATSLYGRIGDEELTNASYRSFSGTTREELLQLEKAGSFSGTPTTPCPSSAASRGRLSSWASRAPTSSANGAVTRRLRSSPSCATSRPDLRSSPPSAPRYRASPKSRSTRPSTPCRRPTARATARQTHTRTSAGTSSARRGQAQAAATPPGSSPAWIG